MNFDDDGGTSRGFDASNGFKELVIVAYLDDFKIIGTAHFGVAGRSSSRRSSDYIHAFRDSRLTLSQVRIYNRDTQELYEAAPFVILNLNKVDFLYAREDGAAGEEGSFA